MDSNNCNFEIDDLNFQVQFDRFPLKIEQMTSVKFLHSSNYVYDSGWVEGTNMFMGKMNLFMNTVVDQEENTQVQLDLFLGACSEPQMRWKMILNLTHIESGEPQRIIVFFQTDYS